MVRSVKVKDQSPGVQASAGAGAGSATGSAAYATDPGLPDAIIAFLAEKFLD